MECQSCFYSPALMLKLFLLLLPLLPLLLPLLPLLLLSILLSCRLPSPPCAGDMLVVARGGKGGSGVRAPTREANKRELDRQRKLAEVSVVYVAGQLVKDSIVNVV